MESLAESLSASSLLEMVSALLIVRATFATTGGFQALQPAQITASVMPRARCWIRIAPMPCHHFDGVDARDVGHCGQGFASMAG